MSREQHRQLSPLVCFIDVARLWFPNLTSRHGGESPTGGFAHAVREGGSKENGAWPFEPSQTGGTSVSGSISVVLLMCGERCKTWVLGWCLGID
jgi:hypothetical protein